MGITKEGRFMLYILGGIVIICAAAVGITQIIEGMSFGIWIWPFNTIVWIVTLFMEMFKNDNRLTGTPLKGE